MKRHRLPIMLGLLSFLCVTIIGALINIITGRLKEDTPYLSYALPALGVAVVVGGGLYMWQYSAERRAEQPATDIPADQLARSRQIMLQKVRATWIEGVLLKSLYREMRLTLGLAADPQQVEIPLRAQVQELGGTRTDLPPGTAIAEVYDRFGGALLILGAPGGGKTTYLLELASELLDRAERDERHAIPVVFNLSSWAAQQLPLDKWLIEELNSVYDVSRALAQRWVHQEAILPLLDGLDEVADEQRAACVTAINAFRATYGTQLAICSRLEEYKQLAAEHDRLRLQGAVTILALTHSEVERFLDHAGASLAGLRAALDTERELWRFAVNPLTLSILAVAYQGKSAAEIGTQYTDTQRHNHLFATYVDSMFNRRASPAAFARQREGRLRRRRVRPIGYTRQQTIHYLAWLAAQMQQRDESIFYIELIQPDWVPLRHQPHLFRFDSRLLGDLIIKMVHKTPAIKPVEAIHWSWATFLATISNRLKRVLILTVFLSLGGGLAGRLFGGLGDQMVFGQSSGLTGGLILGLSFGLIFTVIDAFDEAIQVAEIVANTHPNEGIYHSIRSAFLTATTIVLGSGLLCGLIGGLIGGLIDGLFGGPSLGVFDGLNLGLFGGLIFTIGFGLPTGLAAALKRGGWAVIQHYTLRLLLARAGVVPHKYVPFLDYAAERIFLRKVGGGYIFIHRMLLDYFASLHTDADGANPPPS